MRTDASHTQNARQHDSHHEAVPGTNTAGALQALRRDRRVWLVLAGIAVLCAAALMNAPQARSLVSKTITIDGQVADWDSVVTDPANVVYDAAGAADLDVNAAGDRNIARVAYTYDTNNVYFMFKAAQAFQNSAYVVVYVDVNGNGTLDAADKVCVWWMNPSSTFVKEARVYNYAPSGGTTNTITGDGQAEIGGLGTAVTSKITPLNSGPDGSEPINGAKAQRWATGALLYFEGRVTWATLGVPAGTPLNFHFSMANNDAQIPSSIQDNTGPGTTFATQLALAPNRQTPALPSTVVTFTHTLTQTGNTTDTVNLAAYSANGWPVQVRNPAGGAISSVVLHGNETTTVIVTVSVPATAPLGIAQDVYLTATSVLKSTVTATAHDQVYPGGFVIYPDSASDCATGTYVDYPHYISNLSGSAETVDLTGFSHAGWAVAVRDASNNPTSTVVVAAGSKVLVTLRVTVPAGAAFGLQDSEELRGVVRENPALTASAEDVTTARRRVDITPDNSVVAGMGQILTFSHTISNNWSGADTITVTAASTVPTWSTTLYKSGVGTPISAPAFTLGARETTTVTVVVAVPPDAGSAQLASITLTAVSSADPASRDTATDSIKVASLTTYSDPMLTLPASRFRLGDRVYVGESGSPGSGAPASVYFTIAAPSSATTLGSGVVIDGNADTSIITTAGSEVGTYTAYAYADAARTQLVGSTRFVVTYSALIARLSAGSAVTASETIPFASTEQNNNAVAVNGGTVRYVVWYDSNSDGAFSAGDAWVDGAGNVATWNGGGSPLTHMSTVSVAATSSADDAWGVTNRNFPVAGMWNVTATWTAAGGFNIDTRTSQFYSLGGPTPDLSLAVVAGGSGPYFIGDTVPLKLVVTNSGDTTLATVPLADTFATAGLQYLSSTVTPSSTASGALSWSNVGPLSPGQTTTITVSFKALARGSFTDSLASTKTVDVFGVPVDPRAGSLVVAFSGGSPVGVSDSYTTAEDTTLTVPAPGVLANDSDPDATPLAAAPVTGPSHGSLTLNADGSFTYVPAANYNGSDTFTYRAFDGLAYSATTTVTITITAVNDAPVAVTDSYAATQDVPLAVAAPGALANDTDVDGDALVAVLGSGVSHGSLALNADGSFLYTPVPGYRGSDSFTYRAFDGLAYSAPVTVDITVARVDHAPVVVAHSYDATEDVSLTVAAPGVLAGATDADGDTLAAVLVSGPSHGALTFNADGSFTYTPDANFNGADSFTWKAFDGTLYSAPVTVSLAVAAVNDPPVAAAQSYDATEDVVLSVAAPGVLAGASDVDGDALTAVLVSGPSHGSLTLNADGSFTYTPDANYNGADSFTWKAFDGLAYSAPVAVSLSVATVNDPPVAVAHSFDATEDVPLTVAAPGVLAGATDVDGDALSAALVSGPSHGSLILNADGSFTYTPDANYSGPDSFTWRAFDGALYSDAVTVSLSVAHVNHAPVAVAHSYDATEDVALTVAAPGVLAGATDVDGDALTAALVSGPKHGSLMLNADGSFTYTPDANYNGVDSFTWHAFDGLAYSAPTTVTISVIPVNDPPVAAAHSFDATEDVPLTVAAPGVLAGATDVDGDALSAALVSGPSHGSLILNADGSFTYAPDEGFSGSDSFTWRAFDGALYSDPVSVALTVAHVDHAPVAVAHSYDTTEGIALALPAPGVLAGATDADEDPLTAVLVSGPAHGSLTLNADGSFTYTSDEGFSGSDSFTWRAFDGTLYSEPVTVSPSVAVAPKVNSAPIAAPDSYAVDEGGVLAVPAPGVLANDTDADGDPLLVTWWSSASDGSLAGLPDGSFAYTPAAGFSGVATFTYTVSDGLAGSATGLVTVTVRHVNHAPSALDHAYSMQQGGVLATAAPGVLAGAADADGDALTVSQWSAPSTGTLVGNADGSFSFTPPAGFSGSASWEFTVSDGHGGTVTKDVTVQVSAVAPPAVARDDVLAVYSRPGVVTPLANDDPSVGAIASFTQPAHGTVAAGSTTGTLVYTPASGFLGTDAFVYATDSGATATVRVQVLPGLTAPIDLAPSRVTSTTVHLTWDPPLSVGPGLSGYQVQWRPAGGSWTQLALGTDPDARSADIGGLVPGVAYEFEVIAWDVQSFSATSDPAPFFLKGDVPVGGVVPPAVTHTGESVGVRVGGVPEGSTLSVDPGVADTVPGVGSVHIDGLSITVTPDPGFTGIIRLPVTVTKDGVSTTIIAEITVNPDDPHDITYGPLSARSTLIQWAGVPEAIGYRIFVNGVLVATVGPHTSSYTIGRLLGPNAGILIEALGNDGTISTLVRGAYHPASAVHIATLHFAGDSAKLTASDKRILRDAVALIKAQGFTRVNVDAFTRTLAHGSSAWRKKLSTMRAKATKTYLLAECARQHLKVTVTTAAWGGAHPLGSPLAIRNRRAEIALW